MSLPALLPHGYLPPGVHEATLSEVVERFGTNTPRRQVLASRLQELVSLARATGKLRRIFIWGSFVTDKPFPRDLDLFLLMKDLIGSLPPCRRHSGIYLTTSGRVSSSRRTSFGLPKPSGRQYWFPG